jgi:hypothetical protein
MPLLPTPEIAVWAVCSGCEVVGLPDMGKSPQGMTLRSHGRAPVAT